MKPKGIALSTPQDFLEYQAVLLSAPTDIRRYERAVQPASEFKPLQCLLGYEAQLRDFSTVLRRVGIKPWFLPLPDVYASSYPLANFLNTLGENIAVPHRFLHICFGTPQAARVLKGATNLGVVAGISADCSCQVGYHPFGSGTKLPAAIAGVLTYDRVHAPVTTSDGRELSTCVLDEEFASGPSSDPALEAALDHAYEGRSGGEFHVQSVLEFTSAGWDGQSSGGTVQSLDFRRARIRRNAEVPGHTRALRFSLLPWNMGNKRSLIPDIAVRLSTNKEWSEHEHGIILLPYNEDGTSSLRLQALVDTCRSGGITDCAENVFLMRVTSMRFICELRSMINFCWIDGSDPEWQWTIRRLSRLGFKTLLIVDSELEASFGESLSGLPCERVFSAESSHIAHSNDFIGDRYRTGSTISTRCMRRLLQYTRDRDMANA